MEEGANDILPSPPDAPTNTPQSAGAHYNSDLPLRTQQNLFPSQTGARDFETDSDALYTSLSGATLVEPTPISPSNLPSLTISPTRANALATNLNPAIILTPPRLSSRSSHRPNPLTTRSCPLDIQPRQRQGQRPKSPLPLVTRHERPSLRSPSILQKWIKDEGGLDVLSTSAESNCAPLSSGSSFLGYRAVFEMEEGFSGRVLGEVDPDDATEGLALGLGLGFGDASSRRKMEFGIGAESKKRKVS